MPTRVDLLVAAVLLVVSQIEVWVFGVAGGGYVAAICLGAIAVLSAWRTRFPIASISAIYLVGGACASWSGPPVSATFFVADVLGFYRIGTLRDRRRAYCALGASFLVGLAIVDQLSIDKYLGVVLGSFVVPWLVGTLRLRQQRAQELEAARARAAADERARLARELHDLISHNVGMMVVQASAGDVLLDREPERARQALNAIESGGREALLELRRLLGLLKDGGETELAPQPTLGRLDELVERLRSTGVDVALRVEGDLAGLDPTVDLSAYRIVQEALTNVLKHARATHVDVLVRRLASALEVEVADNGNGVGGPATPGHGLSGIAERVELLGGKLEIGARGDRGFRVHALLPAGAA